MHHRIALFALALAAGCTPDAAADSPPPSAPPAKAAPSTTPAVVEITGEGNFTGMSKDGKRFAWLTPTTTATWLKVATLGSNDFERILVRDREAPEVTAKLADFTPDRRPPPAGVTVHGSLTSKPPMLTVTRGAHVVSVPVGELAYAATEGYEIWGASADGKYLAIHISPLASAPTKAGEPPFHRFLVVATP